MKLSIIVPVHNAERTLEKCVYSILSQNLKETEILLIENNSKDGSYSLCQKLAQENESILCIKSLAQGVSAARNLGLKSATGDIIGFCDADDEFVPEALQPVLDKFQENPAVSVVVGGYYRVSNDNMTYMGFNKDSVCSFNKIINRSIYDSRIMGSVWNKFFKRDLLKDIWFNETLSYCEDTHFLISVLSNSQNNSAYILSKPIYKYINNAESVTRNLSNLFDNKGRLKYINSLTDVLSFPNLKIYTRCLIKRQILLLSIVWYNSAPTAKERDLLRKNILKFFINYILMFYINPIQVPRSIISSLVKKFRKFV